MILQVDIEYALRTTKKAGFYRIMWPPTEDGQLPSYWMWNGTWHFRRPPNLNPPTPWRL